MQATSDLLLSIYDQARNISTNEFIESAFGNMQKILKFDSAGIISLGFSQTGGIQIKGAFAYKFSAEEKYKVRVELGITEKHVQGRGIVGADPLLENCFRNKNRSHTIDSRSVADPRVIEYALKTRATHVLAMVTDDVNGGGFCALSLWRGGAEDKFLDSEKNLADVILPHFFMALNINKRLANTNELFENAYFTPIICGLNGLLNFVDDEVFIFLQEQFPKWTPPYLPKVLLDGLLADSSKSFASKGFTAKGRVVAGTLLVYISKKSDFGNLTKIEFKIAQLLANDVTYKEVAMQLGTSPSTVRNQAHSIYKKLNISKKSSIRSALLLQAH